MSSFYKRNNLGKARGFVALVLHIMVLSRFIFACAEKKPVPQCKKGTDCMKTHGICKVPSDCICKDQICIYRGSICKGNSDCGSRNRCVLNKCVPDRCRNDKDCIDAHRSHCDPGTGVCRGKRLGVNCESTRECESGFRCCRDGSGKKYCNHSQCFQDADCRHETAKKNHDERCIEPRYCLQGTRAFCVRGVCECLEKEKSHPEDAGELSIE